MAFYQFLIYNLGLQLFKPKLVIGGTQGFRRHWPWGAKSLGQACGQHNFPYKSIMSEGNLQLRILLDFSKTIGKLLNFKNYGR